MIGLDTCPLGVLPFLKGKANLIEMIAGCKLDRMLTMLKGYIGTLRLALAELWSIIRRSCLGQPPFQITKMRGSFVLKATL